VEVVYSAHALADLERIAAFLVLKDPAQARMALESIADAVRILARHPNIGRPARGVLRELVISRGRTGYVALYRVVGSERVEVLAIRHPREAGFA